jgi:hypothetical protein
MPRALRVVAVLLALSLIVGESIRTFGQGRPFVFWFDDFLLGGFLILGAALFSDDTPRRRAAFAAAWGATAGMLYGSFFAKLFPGPGSSMQSNIPDDVLTILVGLAFATSLAGLVMTLWLPARTSASP